MGKLCMECLETFKNDAVVTVSRISPNGIYQDCPKRICEGRVYNIDDTILPTIQLLNQKGYLTVSSCGGHYDSEVPELYIEFDETIKSFPFLPFGFKLKSKLLEGKTNLILSYEAEEDDMYSIFPELLGAAEALYDWAEELDIVFDYTMMFFDMQSLKEYLGGGKVEQASPEDIKRIKAEKIKEAAPTGSIKMDLPTAKAESNEEAEQTDESTREAESDGKPSKKRGRPRKDDK